MAGEQLLWTGPYGAALRDYAVASASADPTSLWLVPSPLARDQVRRELAIRSNRIGPGPRVWCRTDLWRSLREGLAERDGPSYLSEGSAAAVFSEAIRQARQAREIDAIVSVIDWPGYRRRLRNRLAEWTASERPTRPEAPHDPVDAAEWAVFVRYRELLHRQGAEDAAGFAVWASRRLLQRPPATFGAFDQVTFLDWETPSPADWRILDHALKRARSVRVTLAYEPDPRSMPLYEAVAPVHDRLRALGFDEVPVRPELWRPAGLREVEQALFRRDGRGRDAGAVAATQGLTIRGAPQGEAVGRMIAREVRARLDDGVDPEEILVLFPEWSEQAEIALEIARDWSLPVQAEPSRPLGADPSVAALLLAIGLPVEGWVTDHLIRLLRNGQVRPGWPGADPLSLAAAASVIQSSSVFRGREPLLRWLERAVANEKGRTVKAERARRAWELLAELFALLDPLDRARPFSEQVDQLVRIADALHLGESDRSGLDPLLDALEDQSGVLERLGRGEAPWGWPAFVREVESIVLDVKEAGRPPRPGAIRMATVGQVPGARAPLIILAGLAEGTFPAREAVEPFLALRPGATPDAASRRAFSVEMLRFARALGSAESGVVLIYPTTDVKGQELLRAGFVDDLLELLTPEAAAACHRSLSRVDPALIDTPGLAGSPGDDRVRAVALARARGDLALLSGLAGRSQHRAVLGGTAAALQVLVRRLRGTPFGEYDGLLKDGDAVLNVAEAFPPEYRFSASQLETYIACPFQFFCKYVLRLVPAERRDEIDEDYTERGSRIHSILQQLEEMKQHIRDQSHEELARIAVGTELDVTLADASEVELGLAEIERRRLIQTIERYAVQLRSYESDPEVRAIPHLFEVEFGDEDSPHPHLEIGRGGRMVRLQGKIDRIDLVDTAEGRGFRVIDYKSGTGPSTTDVRNARLLQLPLYAMAVERIILAEQALLLRDVGYWALRQDGYKPIAFQEWQVVQQALEAYVAELVGRLRQGIFVVDSQVDGCEGFCDYRAICRIRQARLAAKPHDRPEAPEFPVERASRKRRGSGDGP